MARYRKRPVEVEAIRWAGGNTHSVMEFLGDDFLSLERVPFSWAIKVKTLEGVLEARVGDYLIRGVKGEHYPCRADIFEATYEPVDGG